jgi:hypothetical protein
LILINIIFLFFAVQAGIGVAIVTVDFQTIVKLQARFNFLSAGLFFCLTLSCIPSEYSSRLIQLPKQSPNLS